MNNLLLMTNQETTKYNKEEAREKEGNQTT
jgi:hypothetical protein